MANPIGYLRAHGGVSGHVIQVPYIPGNPRGVRDGNNSADSAGGNAPTPQPQIEMGYGFNQYDYGLSGVTEIAKANVISPSDQGHNARRDFTGSMTDKAYSNNSPSRSQYSEGYTPAIQVFASSNTWQIAGQTSKGTRARQPSVKFVSPFSSGAIPTRMPWDL